MKKKLTKYGSHLLDEDLADCYDFYTRIDGYNKVLSKWDGLDCINKQIKRNKKRLEEKRRNNRILNIWLR